MSGFFDEARKHMDDLQREADRRDRYRDQHHGLDPWPAERPSQVVVENTLHVTYVRALAGGNRLLVIPSYPDPALVALANAVKTIAREVGK